MLVHPDDPRAVLIEAADLDGSDDALADVGLSASAGGALREILDWARTYLSRPHPELGRTGDVCPFTRPALERGTFYLAVYSGIPTSTDDVTAALARYREWFATLEPTEQPLAQFKTILVLFPDVPSEHAPALIDQTQAQLKPDYVEAGLMIGEFHDGPPPQGGLWNADFRPLRSPVPLLAIRHMVPTDFPFLRHDRRLFGGYLARMGKQIPRHLREPVREQALAYDLPLPAMPERRRERARDPLAGLSAAEKRAMLAELLTRDPAAEYPATSPQRRLWFVDQLEDGNGALYAMPGQVSLPGRVDLDLLRRAWGSILARHESLRTIFREDDGEPVGVVLAPDDARLNPPIQERARGPEAMADLLGEPFDLASAPLVRLQLARGGDGVPDQALLSFHHIISDDVSIAQVCRELRETYAAFASGTDPQLPPVVQYGDYARWAAEQVAVGAYEPQRAYWVGRLTGAPALLSLPTARPRPAQQSFRGSSLPFELRAGLMAQVDQVAARTGSTRYMVLLAAFDVVLAKLSGSDDVVVGSPVAGRVAPGLEECVGMFVNTVALRTDLGGQPTLEEAVGRTREAVLGALDHQDLPFEDVTEEIATSRSLAYSPIFQTMFVLGRPDVLGVEGRESQSEERVEEVGEGQREEAGHTERSRPTMSRFDLTLVIVDQPETVTGWIDYSTDLFDPEQMVGLTERLDAVLTSMHDRPTTLVDDLDVRTTHERSDATAVAGAEADDVVQLFLHCAAERPDAPAVIELDESGQAVEVSYRELADRSAELATTLARASVRPGDVVALNATRTTDTVVALLAVLRQGAAYLPLDPSSPSARREALIADAGAVALADLLDAGSAGGPPAATPDVDVPSNTPAYVIYTSGSTGTPKGVVVHRRGIAELARQFVDVHGLRPDDRLLMVPPFTFDASAGDIFPALTSGAAMVLMPDPAALSVPALIELARAHGVTAVDTASPLWQQWVAHLADEPSQGAALRESSLRMVWVGGDVVPAAAASRWLATTGGALPLFNHYGPTEATVCATTAVVREADDIGAWPTLPVGRALPGVAVRILDSRLRPVPHGVLGEICIGGPGVAHGYLGSPGQTAARFVPDVENPGGRLYRTGDIGRWGADGRLEFAGRADDQVKIRGYRVEPGEVEGVLGAHPGVDACAVTVVDDAAGRRLVAYAVSRVGVDELAAALAKDLPDYLLPSEIVLLDQLPQTSGGKVDRAALRPPTPEPAQRPYVAPATPSELAVAGIWSDLLNVSEVSATDGFFDLGGHSLLAGRVLARVHADIGVAAGLRTLYAAADLRAFAADLDRLARGEAPLAEQVDLPAQVRWTGGLVTPREPHGAAAGAASPRELTQPLLTGGTGFLGAHLLAELLPRSERVWCLVRAGSRDEARERLRRTLLTWELFDAAELADRIEPLVGDLGSPDLGIAERDRIAARRAIDGVFHVGALVSSARGYHQLAPTNVDGTLDLLRLSADADVQAVHHVSSLGVYRTPSYDGRAVTETTPLPGDPHGIVGAYEQSKWVADRIAELAREAGLPVTIHRPARVAGSSRTGAAAASDFLPGLLRALVHLGSAPALESWALDLYPADDLAAAIARDTAGPGARHYLSRERLPFGEVVAALNDAGYRVDFRAPDEWYDRLAQAQAEDPTGGFAVLAQEFSGTGGNRAEPAFDCSATEQLVRAAGGQAPRVDRDLAARTIDFLARNGRLSSTTLSRSSL